MAQPENRNPFQQPADRPVQSEDKGAWGWLGFGNKTLWDWLVLFIPMIAASVVIGVGVWTFTKESEQSTDAADERAQRELNLFREQAENDRSLLKTQSDLDRVAADQRAKIDRELVAERVLQRHYLDRV